MNRAGRRWHDGRHVRLLDYLRWLVREVERPAKARIDGRAESSALKRRLGAGLRCPCGKGLLSGITMIPDFRDYSM